MEGGKMRPYSYTPIKTFIIICLLASCLANELKSQNCVVQFKTYLNKSLDARFKKDRIAMLDSGDVVKILKLYKEDYKVSFGEKKGYVPVSSLICEHFPSDHKTYILTNKSKIEVRILELREESILIQNNIQSGVSVEKDWPITNIEFIKIKKKSTGKGVLIGAASGFAIGLIAGLSSGGSGGYNIQLSGSEAMVVGLFSAVPGALIGGIIGSFGRVIIPINKSQKTYESKKSEIEKHLYQNFKR
jgi:hypothetical protein